MGKTTNALEKLADAFYYRQGNKTAILDEIKKYHLDAVRGLFPDASSAAYKEMQTIFSELEQRISGIPSDNYSREYDQIVSQGEIISTKIVSAYLNEAGLKNKWQDARDIITTDSTYREGKVNWELTEKNCHSIRSKEIIVTQGFIGKAPDGFTITLGREGSDYTAAILAYCTDAESVTIWKDVPGVMNADPKWFDETKLIDQMSYQDAIEI
jgi:aspartate kinase